MSESFKLRNMVRYVLLYIFSWTGIISRSILFIPFKEMVTEVFQTAKGAAWFSVLISEFLVTSIINAITIIAFARIHHLRKHSTYLIMNLTVADLLMGTVTGPLFMYHKDTVFKDNTWPGFLICSVEFTFPIASQVTLSLISLERLHATLFPFRHCLITKLVYIKVIIASWLITLPLAIVMGILSKEAFGFAWVSFSAITLLVISVCYIIIIFNVQSNPHSQHDFSIHKERKLSITLLIVTGVSVLTLLPWAIRNSMPEHIKKKWHSALNVDLHSVTVVLYFASSMVNPLVYAIRMQEFRKALGRLAARQGSQPEQRLQRRRDHRSQQQTML